MADDTTVDRMVIKEPDHLTPEEIKKLAVQVVDGDVFLTNTEAGLNAAFPLMLLMMDVEPEIAPKIGAIYEETSKAGPRGINGYPFFMSCKLLHHDDLPLVIEQMDAYKKLKEDFTS